MAEAPAYHGWYGEPAARVAVQFPPGAAGPLGVVLCAPLGQEGVIAYRGLRLLADELGRRGMATVRYDPPGRGDAAPCDDPSGVFEGARSAATLLRQAGCTRIAFVGLSSAALAAAAVAEPRDVVVLWSPPSSGRQWLRRARALATIMLGPDRTEDGIESLIGLELTQAQADALAGVELVRPAGSPTLVVSRRGESVPAGYAGSDVVEVDDVVTFLDVSSNASILPVSSVRLIADWLGTLAGSETTVLREPVLADELVLPQATERIRLLGPDRLFAIETRPRPDRRDAPMVVLHSGAAEHRVGPGDFQVELARVLAGDGLATLRVDRRGTGETGPVSPDLPDLMYAGEWADDQANVVDALGLPGDRLAFSGMCSGAWVAAQPSVERSRLYLAIHPARYELDAMEPGEFADVVAPSVVTGGVRLWAQNRYRRWAPTWLRRLRARSHGGTDASAFLERVSEQSDHVVMVFSEVDHEIFRQVGGEELITDLPNIETVELATVDHPMFARRTRQVMLTEVRERIVRAFAQ